MPLEYLHLFYIDSVLAKIADFTTAMRGTSSTGPSDKSQGVTVYYWLTFVWGCCHRSRVEGLLLPLILDGQFK